MIVGHALRLPNYELALGKRLARPTIARRSPRRAPLQLLWSLQQLDHPF